MGHGHEKNQATSAMNQILVLASLVFFFGVLIFLVVLCIYALMRRRVYLELPLPRRSSSWLRRLSSTRENLNASRLRNTGLDAKIVETLPIFEYTESINEMGTDCCVCLSQFENGEKVRVLPNCKHGFHTACIDMWFHSQSNCPLCRTKVDGSILPVEERDVNIADSNDRRNVIIDVNIADSNDRQNVIIDVNIAVDQGQTSFPSTDIDLSTEPSSFSTDMEVEEINSPGGSQSSRFSRLHSLKRMLSGRSRDGKVFPTTLHQTQNETEEHS